MSTAPPALPSTSALPQLRPARADDYPRIQRLEAAHGLLTLPEDRWREVVLEHPLRPRLGPDAPIGWVLEDDHGDLVGSLLNVPTLHTLGDAELVAATGRAWVVEPAYRGVALWLVAEYFSQPGVDLFINTTVNAQAVEAFCSFGSRRVPLGDFQTAAYWVTNHRGFAASALRLKGWPAAGPLSAPAGAALWMVDALREKALPAASGCLIRQLDTFDHTFDAFWAELRQTNPGKLLAVRDGQALRWHFGAAVRAGRAWVLAAYRHGLMRAYVVLKRQDHPPSGLVRMRLVDCQCLGPEVDVDLLPSLFRAALGRCRLERIHTLEHVGMGLPRTACLDQAAPYRRRLGAWPYYYHAPDPALDARLSGPECWDPSSYDGDASL